MYKIEYLDIKPKKEYETIISKVLQKCFEIEKLPYKQLWVSVILTTPKNIQDLNKEHRGIDKSTDVLSFPMFEKDELPQFIGAKTLQYDDVLGDMVISIEQVEKQAKEYNHSFERELSYMVVHSFYHLLGYDHILESDKIQMREKEEYVLNNLGITRE